MVAYFGTGAGICGDFDFGHWDEFVHGDSGVADAAAAVLPAKEGQMKWMQYRGFYFGLSLLIIVPGIAAMVMWGFKPAIDFTGGSLAEIRVTADETGLRKLAQEEGVGVKSVQSLEDGVLVRMEPIDQAKWTQLRAKWEQSFGTVEELRFETVGPTLGRELLMKTITAVALAAGLILLYIAYRFRSMKFGICAVMAMLHDTLVLLGSFSLLGRFYGVEVDTLFVTAMLTILSFSVHDTIVVYDRIREMRKLKPKLGFEEVVNEAVTTTLSRSINNSMTIIFMLLALFLLGGATIRWFVLALLIGTISGTYSSTFTAAPLLVVWEKVVHKNKSI